MENEVYYGDYENEPIGGGNPYYRCVHCKISDPEINGALKRHAPWCEYRLKKEQEIKEKQSVNIKAGTNKIWVYGDRNHPFIAAYMDLPKEQQEELSKVIRVTLFDGDKLSVSEMVDWT